MPFQRPGERTAARLVYACFAAGLLISVGMLARSVTGGDQLNLLARGWLWAARGQLIPYGNPLSSGGKSPGGITTLLVGLPLFVWMDYRAPTVVILLFQTLGFLLLDATLRRILAPHERLLFAVVYWLNPWRLFLSGFLWNPSYLFLFGAVHLWSCLAQRERPRFWASFLHAAGMVLAFQIHPSFLLLAVASVLLWWRKYFKVQWMGAVLGALAAALPLVPWYLEVRAHPAIFTAAAGKGFPGRGLLYVFPLLRGVSYWLRYGSLYVADNISAFDFRDLLGSGLWGGRLGTALMIAARVLIPFTLLPALLANRRLWRPVRRRFERWRRVVPRWSFLRAAAGFVISPATLAPPPEAPGRAWLRGYVLWSFVGAVLVFSLSPTTIMFWQVLPLFHIAVLPVVLWVGALWRSRRARDVGRSVLAWAALSVSLGVAIALGSPQYRCNGREPMRFSLVDHSPMFEELGIQAGCPWSLDRPGGWWPDVLPKASHEKSTERHALPVSPHLRR
jgi:hypothetical protein